VNPAHDAARPSPAAGPVHRPVLLGIDGRSGAGKTTLARRLLRALLEEGIDARLFHLEEIYPGWHGLAAGVEAYVEDVLAPLSAGESARWRTWDWATDSPGAERETRPAAVVLCEGVGAGAPAARPLLSACLTLEAPDARRKERALARDGETYRPFWDVWAAQEEALPAAADGPGDLRLGAEDPGAFGQALAWARRAAATAARR
jgi:para-aminobenzoate synthetase